MSDWKLVPVEPTGDMLNLLWLELGDHPCREHAMDAWRSALAAAPDAPVEIVPREWREALRELTFMARTSGGTSGPDAGLQSACAKAEALLVKPYNYPQWPAPRPMSEAPKDVKVLAWWPTSKEWIATWWVAARGVWFHVILDAGEPNPTHWLPMPAAPTEQEKTT